MTKTLKLSDIYVKKNDTVTQSSNGLMLYQDKIKLDSLENTIASAINNIDLTDYVTETEIQNNYVAKDGNKVLSDNNFSNTYKSALDNLSIHGHGNLQNDGTIKVSGTVQKNKNLVTDNDGNLSTEDKYSHPSSHPASMITGLSSVATSGSYNDLDHKPTIPTVPSASSTTPGADTANGSVGTGTTWAKADHTHPRSTIYAKSEHTHSKSEITDFPVIEMDTATLNISNLYASTSFVNFMRIGNKVMATGVLNTVSLANTNQEYNVFNGFDYTKPSSDITVKTANTRNNSDFTFQIKTNGSGYVTPKTANTGGTLHFNVVYSIQSTGGGGYVVPPDG